MDADLWDNFDTIKSPQQTVNKIKPFEVALVGTSMVKHIDSNKLFENKKCFFKSISGGLIKDVFEFLKKRDGFFIDCKIIVLTAGSNDCDSLNDISKVISDYLDLAQYLNKTYPNAKLVFNKLIPRLKTRYTKLEEFELKRACFNNFLESTLFALVPCKIVNHEGFEIADCIESLLVDGVHMSPLKGVSIYVNEIKSVLQALY